MTNQISPQIPPCLVAEISKFHLRELLGFGGPKSLARTECPEVAQFSQLRISTVGRKSLQSLTHLLLQLDDRQITHLVCVRLRYLLYDLLGVFWASFRLYINGPKTPLKSHIANVLGGDRLDE